MHLISEFRKKESNGLRILMNLHEEIPARSAFAFRVSDSISLALPLAE